MKSKVTRKEFFQEGAKYALGISAGLTGIQALLNKRLYGKSSYVWPWPYTALDIESTRILGHDAYWTGNGCSYAAFHAIVEGLRNAIGAPFTDLPSEIMIYCHGGGAGWGTLCGALNGAAAAISLVCLKADSDLLVSELIGWYTQTAFPSDISNQYAVNHTFNDNRCDIALPQNVSDSPLCHVSVTEWCNAASYGVAALERKERCARLSGDVAAYATKILNDFYANQFNPQYVPPAAIAGCLVCHGSGGLANNVAAKMNCIPCHGEDPHSSSDIKEFQPIPSHHSIEQNYPNPFNPETTFTFSLSNSEKVTLSVYNINGKHITTILNNQPYPAGTHHITWNGTDHSGNKVSSGMYFFRFKAGSYIKSKSMLLVR